MAIVADGHVDRVVALADLNYRSMRETVLGRVRQGLLRDAVDRGLKVGGAALDRTAAFLGQLDADIDRETFAFKSLGQGFDRCLRAELVYSRRSQTAMSPRRIVISASSCSTASPTVIASNRPLRRAGEHQA